MHIRPLQMLTTPPNRTITLIVALATLTSNVLSALFFYQLPDDPYHLASNFGWYLHFANLLSVFGFIGALRVCLSYFSLVSPSLISVPPSLQDSQYALL
ncbi:hypothetical protein DL98DRAFT_510942 [Cadophora sp. DSE1049]|nr:hypothetical protein DL98DRAFT_510942 [Cadophora sp. DSE1049]